ncbi:alternative ribosome rescue aminoacyl-tRNA hydrolase ArfB [Pseudoalteromonas sp. SSMSWG5]|jgi:ribosome-associated protein|uniref:alternative ribosome rescue aminoacyl-tRNA hydrolase ArfB n=1 Tax=Pseudoalteromonas TaxID=53246 RepID=UPI000EEA649A|nr:MULTISPECIES: alternative ribosome rescue aminoacyl-tRNA hydrolase ArfB [unclassified Pseudoalteromonas]HCV05952.1 aminoacyl-tRNA hydrolase [Pseudoalteromonas sp.]MCF2899200.1 aminoacyl-tRNA hydrolase [Pseudoalteromonas sp. OFAV1]MCF2921952.1 aminoacyl-tRNA hydrolase [Pseudoalteromonas sp. APAL1]MCO7250141.1 aminoacyl-tRNA hydrolase [Pseudoalteromonas sp. Ps84H-4]TGV17292.1 aminoacyl-tRNA hydrolase [Pseudoalteromonas sp. MEBiC 03607]|tara:strand:- start:786 stop:1199 length:414 start_codon:yes stop_codon:yes gene_type:complete
MLIISNTVTIDEWELDFSAIRSQGAGGQNVNKVASAIHLRFDIKRSKLPDFYKQRLLNLNDSRITKEGVIVIKSQTHRTQELNKEDALNRLKELIISATQVQKKRRATKPTKSSQRKRMDSKTKRGQTKALRKNIDI